MKIKEIEKCNILNVDIVVTDMKKTLNYIEKNFEKLKGEYICVSNVHTTVMAYENENYRKIQNGGALALPDGKPLSVFQKKVGFKDAERVTGPDLMEEIFKVSEEKGYKHYFYGSTVEVLDKLEKELKGKYPNLDIVGMHSPPFRSKAEKESKEKIEEIKSRKSDFIWVGLGAPKQEEWMYLHQKEFDSLMIGVGAGFEYHAQIIKRAPTWMQKLSLEWLYRLCQDPKRLIKRYTVTNSKFMYLAIFNKKINTTINH